MNNPLVIRQVRPDGMTSSQIGVARALADLQGPSTMAELAAHVGVEEAEIESWFADPHFRSMLMFEMEQRASIQVALVWRGIYRQAVSAPDPKLRMEAAKLYLARFDPGLRACDRDVARGVETFAERLAERAVEKVAPGRVSVMIQPTQRPS